jgi:microcystin-dependent protein
MSEPFVGEIRMVGFNFAPFGWAMCNGQLLPISQYQAVFAVVGTIYGGDGQSTFAVPNLQSRVPIHWGQRPGGANYVIGQTGGEENHTVALNEMAQHIHVPTGSNTATINYPAGAYWANAGKNNFTTDAPNGIMGNVGLTGGGLPHTNIQPYLTITFIMALEGVFPSRN